MSDFYNDKPEGHMRLNFLPIHTNIIIHTNSHIIHTNIIISYKYQNILYNFQGALLDIITFNSWDRTREVQLLIC